MGSPFIKPRNPELPHCGFNNPIEGNRARVSNNSNRPQAVTVVRSSLMTLVFGHSLVAIQFGSRLKSLPTVLTRKRGCSRSIFNFVLIRAFG
jgi:hypothetical protein